MVLKLCYSFGGKDYCLYHMLVYLEREILEIQDRDVCLFSSCCLLPQNALHSMEDTGTQVQSEEAALLCGPLAGWWKEAACLSVVNLVTGAVVSI